MHEMHCKYCLLIPPLVFNNNLNLLIYGCMCVWTRRHIPKYMDRMSNNNKMLINNSRAILQFGLYTLGIRWSETKVYRWVFSCLDYSFNILVSWSRKLSLYNSFCSYSILFSFINFMMFHSLGDNSGYMNSRYGDVRYTVYIWGFPRWIIPSI